ncbi:hypothetical protein [Paenibacillus sp. YAF4_2]|uniref:hypothetical protein n=1 Tax=Paenibacillus sp. YAF4_2 TaxID=3233085 RepID=UPI003F97FA34
MISNQTIARQWINDYLDLYNYAKQIGDIEWQQQLIRILARSEEESHQLALTRKASELWQQFDIINKKMMDLYHQLRTSDDSSKLRTLQEEVWVLRLKRVELSRRFKETM